jgi:hypothetical protein
MIHFFWFRGPGKELIEKIGAGLALEGNTNASVAYITV